MKRHGTLILGGVATGKTTLLHDLCARELAADDEASLLYFGTSAWSPRLVSLLDKNRLAPPARRRGDELTRVVREGLAHVRGESLDDHGAVSAEARELLEALRVAPELKATAPGRITLAVDELLYFAGPDPHPFLVYLRDALDACHEAPRLVPIFASTTLSITRIALGRHCAELLESFRTVICLRYGGGEADDDLLRLTDGSCSVRTGDLRPGEAVVLDREAGTHEVRLLLPWS